MGYARQYEEISRHDLLRKNLLWTRGEEREGRKRTMGEGRGGVSHQGGQAGCQLYEVITS
jgi:hypothetical protein